MGCFAVLAATYWPSIARKKPSRRRTQEQTTDCSCNESSLKAHRQGTIIRVTEVCRGELATGGKPNLYSSPAVQDFHELIENDAWLKRLFTQMFQEIPREPRFEHDAGGHLQVRNHQAMLRRIDDIITQAPEFNSTFYAGFPINALLAWPMATSSGVAAFLDDKVNAHIRDILDAWASFLKSPESTYVLSDDSEHGWFGSMALALMPNFAEEYICDSTKPHYGFKSWDDYFTREFREGIRPVEFPDSASIISNACESAPYCLACGVSLYDRFWMKDQSYSLEEMLAYDSLAPSFEGGTVYQAYLSCTNYHRWHSPMSGIVKKAYRQPGAYYAQCPSVGFDGSTPNGSQAYLTHVATRAIIFIEADNRDIGLTCFMAVGMAECSSCEITVSPGQQVKRGDQLGSFHYGGSTYCLLFQPETRLRFKDESKKSGDDASVLRVNSALAFVESSG